MFICMYRKDLNKSANFASLTSKKKWDDCVKRKKERKDKNGMETFILVEEKIHMPFFSPNICLKWVATNTIHQSKPLKTKQGITQYKAISNNLKQYS